MTKKVLDESVICKIQIHHVVKSFLDSNDGCLDTNTFYFAKSELGVMRLDIITDMVNNYNTIEYLGTENGNTDTI